MRVAHLCSRRTRRCFSAWLLTTLVTGCEPYEAAAEQAAIDAQRAAVIYGNDDRREVFEASERWRSVVSASMVVLADRDAVSALLDEDGVLRKPPPHGSNCTDEPFVGQPVVAWCTGVLVDWDLVVTAGHCLQALPLERLVVLFGYYYTKPGLLAATHEDVYEVREVITADSQPLDFAWLRLARDAAPPRTPASVYAHRVNVSVHQEVVSVSAAEGLPLKIDLGGRVHGTGFPEFNYLTANTDTFNGSSGGALFDTDGGLVGIHIKGARDYRISATGCRESSRHDASGTEPMERFLYSNRLVEALCATEPSGLCSTQCAQPCHVGPRPGTANLRCSYGTLDDSDAHGPGWWALAVLLSPLAFRQRRLPQV